MLLAIETSSRTGSVALHDGQEVVAERSFAHGLQNAASILPLIDELCKDKGIAPRDLTDIAVSIGPGSFTGLRIGVTLAKTICFATGAKLLAVESMPVMALNAPAEATHVMPILDAKRDQVFAAVYSIKGRKAEGATALRSHTGATLDEVLAPQLARLPDVLAKAPRPIWVLGEGIREHRKYLEGTEAAKSDAATQQLNEDGIIILPETLWYPKASTVALLALRLKAIGAYADPFKLTPLYIRKPEAQERMEAGLLKHLEM